MKKSVFALAAMTAAAGVAQAQSSVSVYGIIDAGYKSVESDAVAVSSNVARVTNTKITGISGVGSESTSRFGFRGTEDIGGGLKANFVFEVGMDPAGSTLTPMNNRQAFVGLEKAGIGRLDFGTQYTAHHSTMARFSPSTLPNVPGAIDYTQSVGSLGLGAALSGLGIISTVGTVAVLGNGTGGGVASAVALAKQNEINNALITAGLRNGTVGATSTTAPTDVANVLIGTTVLLTDATTGASATDAETSGVNKLISNVNSSITAASTAALNTRLARSNNTSYTVRNNNVVNLQSPTINGFQAGVAYVLPSQTTVTGQTAIGSNDEAKTTAMIVNASYSTGPFAAAAAYSAANAKTVVTTAAISASTAVQMVNGLTTLTAAATDVNPVAVVSTATERGATAATITTVEVKTVETMGAASYDFGPAKVSYIYTKRTAKDTVSDLSDKTAHNLGVKAPFGATTAFASYTVGKQTILGSTVNQNQYDLRGIQAGVSYALSKRTDAYAIYGTSTMDNKANVIDLKDTGYAVGVRHTF